MFRQSLFVLSAALLSLPAGRPATAAEGAPFSFVVLGDLHFDRPEHHDLLWLERDHPNDVHQVRDYTAITAGTLPRLFAEVREAAAQASPHATQVFQLGDLVEGLCGSPDLARKQAEDAIAFVKNARLGVPFLSVKGNHDITGPGAADTYRDVLLPFFAGQAGRQPGTACFSLRQGDSLFACFDAYQPDGLDWLEQTLAAQPARHVFVLIHPPVVPFNARSLWHVYASASQQSRRRRLLSLLGRHHAIVLCGHLHEYGVVVRRTEEGGRFVQLALSSVLSRPDAGPARAISGREQYGPDLVTREPQFEPKSEAQRRQSLADEAPFVEYFETAEAAGYAVVTVQGDQVRATIYTGLGRRLWKTLDLTKLLAGPKAGE